MPNWKKLITSGSDAALNSLNVSTSLTASGLIYPTSDNGEESFIQTDGSGNLSLQYVKTIYEEVVNGESTNLIKGTPVYISGSIGAAGIAYRADAGNPLKMPVVYIVADTIAPTKTGRGIALGLITGVNTTGFPAGTEIYVAVGGGWTSTRPTGSAIVQSLGFVTKEGAGGMGVVLNPGPNSLPNIQSGYVWVGDSNSYPIAIPSSSIQNVVSASFALTASYALSGGSGGAGTTVNFTQPTPATTWSFTHNLNTRNPIVQVYNTLYEQIIPNNIIGVDEMVVEIQFDYAQDGYAVASNGGSLAVTGSTTVLNQTSSSVTWSFNHNLNSKYINFEVYDDDDYVIIPSSIRVIDTSNAELTFATPTTGKAVAQFSGINGLPNAASASYAENATSASYAENANLLNGKDSTTFATTGSNIFIGNQTISTGYVILSEVSSSLNFEDDAAAAAGGVPLGGLYRNGNFILIRLT